MSMATEEVINELINIVKEGKGFVLEQAPDLARQAVILGRTQTTATTLLTLLVLLLCYKLGRIFYKKNLDDLIYFPVGVVALVGAIGFCFSFREFLIAWLSPKIFLLEYLAGLTKDCSR